MSSCALCDSPAAPGEALCAACLADPELRGEHARIARQAWIKEQIAARFSAAKSDLGRAREYVHDGDAGGARARACVDHARALRGEIRGLRAQAAELRAGAVPPSRPGLKKAEPRSAPAPSRKNQTG